MTDNRTSPATHGAPSREALEALLAHTVGEIFKHAVASRGLFDPKNCPGCAAIVPTLLATIETVSTPTLRAPEVTDEERMALRLNDLVNWMLGENGDFPTPPDGLSLVVAAGADAIKVNGERIPLHKRPLYWWRKELRRRRDEIVNAKGSTQSETASENAECGNCDDGVPGGDEEGPCKECGGTGRKPTGRQDGPNG